MIAYEYGDSATCETRLKLECELYQGLAGAAGTAPSSACAASVAAASCDQVFDLTVSHAAGCVGSPGTLVDGSGCGAETQCKSGYCKSAEGETCGVCAAKPAISDGCADTADCPGASVCVQAKCVKLGGKGDACSDDKPCRLDLWCKSGTCATPAGPGEGCEVAAPLSCALFSKSVWCNEGTCAKVKFGKPGDACDKSTICAGNLCLNGTCGAFAKDGAACSDTQPCLRPAECTGGVCKLPNPAACK